MTSHTTLVWLVSKIRKFGSHVIDLFVFHRYFWIRRGECFCQKDLLHGENRLNERRLVWKMSLWVRWLFLKHHRTIIFIFIAIKVPLVRRKEKAFNEERPSLRFRLFDKTRRGLDRLTQKSWGAFRLSKFQTFRKQRSSSVGSLYNVHLLAVSVCGRLYGSTLWDLAVSDPFPFMRDVCFRKVSHKKPCIYRVFPFYSNSFFVHQFHHQSLCSVGLLLGRYLSCHATLAWRTK